MKMVTMPTSAKFSEQFSGIAEYLKPLLIRAGGLKLSASDKEIFAFLDSVIDANGLLKENYELRYQKAKLTIDKMMQSGMIEADEKDAWIKLATVSFDTTMEVIQRRKYDKSELIELLKLSGRQLYMNGKLERLKELSEPHFKLKYSELQNVNYHSIPETKTLELTYEEPVSELERLVKLSAKQLYMDGLLERLKELDFGQFKLKYKEFFNVEYPF
jgi:hypothetical protein